MLVKKSDHQARRGSLVSLVADNKALDRRAFLRRSGIGTGSLAVLGTMPLGTVRKAEAAGRQISPEPRVQNAITA